MSRKFGIMYIFIIKKGTDILYPPLNYLHSKSLFIMSLITHLRFTWRAKRKEIGIK